MKNPFDKCYANTDLTKFVMKKTILHIPLEEITEIEESAAGDGAFVESIKLLCKELNIPYGFYDIKPEHPEVLPRDFIKDFIPYKKGKLIITGPPYTGKSMQSFAKKSSEVADYVVFISPITAYNIKYPVPTLECIAQYNLGFVKFRGKKEKWINTAVMIYKRIPAHVDEVKLELKLDFDIASLKRNNHYKDDYDYYLSSFGDNTGKVSRIEEFSASVGIKVKNELLRPKVEKFLVNFRDNHLKEIDGNSITFIKRRSINMTKFRNWFKEEVYK